VAGQRREFGLKELLVLLRFICGSRPRHRADTFTGILLMPLMKLLTR
jgi:hypothetical protein